MPSLRDFHRFANIFEESLRKMVRRTNPKNPEYLKDACKCLGAIGSQDILLDKRKYPGTTFNDILERIAQQEQVTFTPNIKTIIKKKRKQKTISIYIRIKSITW